jgi:hypothetical protein
MEVIAREQVSALEPDEIALLRGKVRQLERDNEQLTETVERLRQQMTLSNPEPVDQKYSMDQFMLKLGTKRGRTYAWRSDYARATTVTPGCQVVTTDDIQKWQKEKRVPDWAYLQIDWLEYPNRSSQANEDWSDANDGFLVKLYVVNPHVSNAVLAAKCTQHFGRCISEQAIKGKIYRLGKLGRLPFHRPARD